MNTQPNPRTTTPRRTLALAGLALGLFSAALVLPACEEDGPAEEAGEKIDEAVEEAGDNIEDAADDLEDAVDDGIEDVTDDDG